MTQTNWSIKHKGTGVTLSGKVFHDPKIPLKTDSKLIGIWLRDFMRLMGYGVETEYEIELAEERQ